MPPKTTTLIAQTDRVVLLVPSILAYTTAVSKGDAPITTLLQQQDIEVELAVRHAKVQREVDDAMKKLKQEPAKYVSLPFFVPKKPKTCHALRDALVRDSSEYDDVWFMAT